MSRKFPTTLAPGPSCVGNTWQREWKHIGGDFHQCCIPTTETKELSPLNSGTFPDGQLSTEGRTRVLHRAASVPPWTLCTTPGPNAEKSATSNLIARGVRFLHRLRHGYCSGCFHGIHAVCSMVTHTGVMGGDERRRESQTQLLLGISAGIHQSMAGQWKFIPFRTMAFPLHHSFTRLALLRPPHRCSAPCHGGHIHDQ